MKNKTKKSFVFTHKFISFVQFHEGTLNLIPLKITQL